MDNNNRRLMRWVLQLQPYNLEVMYKPECEMNRADGISMPAILEKEELISSEKEGEMSRHPRDRRYSLTADRCSIDRRH